MDASLLKVKIQVPPIRPDLVPRSRLIEKLNSGLYHEGAFTRHLTLVSAPAGYGKSTLVRQFVSGFGPRAAWISIDEGDNDLSLFWSYFVSSLQRVEKDIGSSLLAYIRAMSFSPGESAADALALPEKLLITLINELTELKDPIMIVLDDFHLISESRILDKIAFLVENLPCKAHLVLVTRHDPPWPLSRWRSRGVMTEVRQADLRFSDKESGEFLEQVMRVGLSGKDISTLTTRTEGWITGLQMAAVSIRDCSDVGAFIENFTGSSRYILDYLSEEVLKSQREDVQSFLLKTSILNNLNSELCDALTGGSDGQCLLETLESANLFIISLDDERRWYRYHALFAGLLRHRLKRTHPQLVSKLHLKASNWYKKMGIYIEAIEHSYDAEDFAASADLLVEARDFLWQKGEYLRLMCWLRMLPQKEFEGRPELLTLNTLLLIREGHLSEARECLKHLDKILAGSADRIVQKSNCLLKLRGEAATLHAFLSLLCGDAEGICRYSREALEMLPAEDTFWRCGALIVSGDAHAIQNDLKDLNRAYQSALDAGKSLKNPFAIFLAGQKMGLSLWNQGRLDDTAELCSSLLHYAQENNFACTGRGGTLWALWGDVLRERNVMNEAKEYVQKGYELSQTENMARGWCGYCLIRLQLSEGDCRGAEKTIEELSPLMKQSPLLSAIISPMRAKIYLGQDDLNSAAGWMKERGITLDEKYNLMRELEYLSAARVMAAKGSLEEAVALLERICSTQHTGRRLGTMIETLSVKALIYRASGRAEEAHKLLREALALAEPEGYIRIFLDEGQPMVRLLQEVYKGHGEASYGKMLLNLFANPQSEDDKKAHNSKNNCIEALSERELEVLALASRGLSNKAIAERLYLSLSTVKWHTSNIFGKLGVDNRTEAVARARDMGLL